MAKRSSRKAKSGAAKTKKSGAAKNEAKKLGQQVKKARAASPHRSFRRTYREDYRRELNVPGTWRHIGEAFKILGKNWRLFLPLFVLAVVLNILLVGLPVQASGIVMMVLVFLMLWLTTIYLLRQRMARHELNLRDGLYNAMTPLVPTLVVFLVAAVECLPIVVLVVTYSAAVQTDLFATPFYALMYFVFAVLMILLAGYLLAGSLMALVAVSAPGLYPWKALTLANELMMGRRIRLVLRLLALAVLLAVIWVVVLAPFIGIDSLMNQFEWSAEIPFVALGANLLLCFSVIYGTAYLYLYYRWMLEGEEKDE